MPCERDARSGDPQLDLAVGAAIGFGELSPVYFFQGRSCPLGGRRGAFALARVLVRKARPHCGPAHEDAIAQIAGERRMV